MELMSKRERLQALLTYLRNFEVFRETTTIIHLRAEIYGGRIYTGRTLSTCRSDLQELCVRGDVRCMNGNGPNLIWSVVK